jgi:hypothetical protein
MPGDEETEVVVEKPKRAPRKRAPKLVLETDDATSAAVTRAPRKRTSKARVEAETMAPTTPPPRVANERMVKRKAPTPIAETRATKKNFNRQIVVVVLLLIVGIGASAGVGITDKGGIDINQKIEDRNNKIRAGEIQDDIIPIQNTNTEPNGGLIPVEGAPQPAPAPVATTTASSSAATASSTEATASSTVDDALVPVGESVPDA